MSALLVLANFLNDGHSLSRIPVTYRPMRLLAPRTILPVEVGGSGRGGGDN